LTQNDESGTVKHMKIYIEKHYDELVEGDRFYSMQEDCGFALVCKIKAKSGWEWNDGKSCLVYEIAPDTVVWAEYDGWGWYEYLIRICCAILALLFIAFFCYAVWKG
jgi:hypothetical protein